MAPSESRLMHIYQPSRMDDEEILRQLIRDHVMEEVH